MTDTVRLTDIFSVPAGFDGITSDLEDVLGRIGLKDFSIAVTPPSVLPGDGSPVTEVTEAEALEYLEWFEGEDSEPPTGGTPPQDSAPADTADGTSLEISFELAVVSDVVIDLPGLDGVSFVVNPCGMQAHLSADEEGFELGFESALAIRFDPNLLRPYRAVSQQDGKLVFEPDPSRPYTQIELANVAVTIDETGSVDFDAGAGIQISDPVMIGETGVIIETADIVLNLSGTGPQPAGTPPGWKGLMINTASLRIPDIFQGAITATGFGIGSGGVSGTLSQTFALSYAGGNFSGDLVGDIFGMQGGLSEISIVLQQNIPTGGGIKAQIKLPFFEDTDQPLDIEIGLAVDGGFTVAIDRPDGLITLTKPDLFSLSVDSLGFAVVGGVFTVLLSGKITPLFGGLDWPSFDIQELSIDSDGNVKLEGGWLNLPSQYAIDFYGFQFEITQLGFGKTDDGGKWLGFSGGLKLVDGLSAGASVEGLRVTWYEDGRPTGITFSGVGVEFEVPEVLRFKGEVSYRTLQVGDETVHRFDGAISLELTSIGLEIDAILVVGTASGPSGSYAFFAIYLGVELPAGIPLWSTGLALYGLAGLFALQMEPDKQSDEPWYGIGDGEGWYKRPEIGVTDLEAKWVNRRDSLALGAGITIGSVADNGFTFSGRLLFVIVFPGPILMFEGKANLLKERSSLDDEPIFRALAVLDGRAGTFLFGLDAQYRYGSGGELIDIGGSVEAFFSLSDADAWHLYIGMREPREKRIRAQILSLFESNSYFMLDAYQAGFGAWVGYDKTWKFGPLRVTVEAWIEGNAVISWKPAHLYGDLWLHGKVELKVFGFGLGLSLDAYFEADVFDPFHVLARFSVGINLPWPLPDFDATITLEWGPEPTPPLLPLPLKEVAVEHFKVTTSWPLLRGELLRPVYDGDADGLLDDSDRDGTPNPAGLTGVPDLSLAPIVPLDARPHITFGRAVHDDALVGVNAQPVSPPYEIIGDPEQEEGPVKVRYGLKEVALEKQDGGNWQVVARKAATYNVTTEQWDEDPNPAGVKELYGSWAPMPALPAGNPAPGSDPPVGNVKLWLWSRNPFDYTRHTGRAWDEWFTDRFSNYPCIPDAPDRVICCDFNHLDPGEQVKSPYICGDRRNFVILAFEGGFHVVNVAPPIAGKGRALCPTYQKFADIVIGSPAEWVEVTALAPEPTQPKRTCIDFLEPVESSAKNPLERGGASFLVFDPSGQPLPINHFQDFGDGRGLNLGFGAEISLPCPVNTLRLTLSLHAGEITIKALDANGNSVSSTQAVPPGGGGGSTTVSIPGSGITHLVLAIPNNEALLKEICFICEANGAGSGISATGWNADNDSFGPFQAQGNVVRVEGKELRRVRVAGEQGLCIVQICANIGPDPAEKAEREEMAQHLIDELARWSTEGEVLDPHAIYRVKLTTTIKTIGMGDYSSDSTFNKEHELTEYAYFRTEGAPGLADLSLPANTDNEDEATLVDGEGNFITVNGAPSSRRVLKSDLNSLALYVTQTIPPTVPDTGEKPLLPRPVYCAYDVGVDFNEDYVDLMYLIQRRDLGLYLYDNNNSPVRDAQGRLIVLSNRWGVTPDLTLTESEDRWISVLDSSTCVLFDPTVIPHEKTLTSSQAGQVLDPDRLYEARLVPLLLHETFARFSLGETVTGPSGTLDGWQIVDNGTSGGPSQWQVGEDGTPPSRFIEQTSNIWGGTTAADDPDKPGALLVYTTNPSLPSGSPDQPQNWTDYRLSVFIRSADDDALGVVFRYQDSDNYYRFSMDRERKYRRLVRFVDGNPLVLAEDDFVYLQDQDYLITVEAIGPELAIYQDGEPIFSVSDPAFNEGSVGVYCWASQGARFTDLRVDDFRVDAAPVVYRFEFITSNFAHFMHHLHSYQDETWRLPLEAGTLPDADLAALIAEGVTPATDLLEDEARAYDSLAQAILGPAAHQNPPELRASRVERGGETIALLVESPEPLDWQRTDLAMLRADRQTPLPGLPEAVKLTGATFASSQPNEESVALLLRQAADLTGHQIQLRSLPGVLQEPAGNPILFSDDFESGARGLLFQETFGSSALNHYTIVDEGSTPPTSHWYIAAGRLVQDSNIWGGSLSASPLQAEKPGTMAVTGSPQWRNARITARLRSTDDDAIGLVFRYQDADNYYRFSMDRERGYRRLIKKVEGAVTVLWEDSVIYDLDQPYDLVIEAHNDRLIGFLGNQFLFSVGDGSLRSGQVGFYCWANQDAFFEKLEVEALDLSPLLWQPAFADMSGLSIVDAPGAASAPSQWSASGGLLRQTSNIHIPGGELERPGTYAVEGSGAWGDILFSVRLHSTDNDALGVLFRYQDDDNYYRFAMNRQESNRRLIKKVGSTVTLLWQDAVPFVVGQSYDLTLRLVGSRLTAYLDGALLFDVHDPDLRRGAVGFYSWANTDANFERIIVTDLTRRMGPWTILDTGTISGPSIWQQKSGSLLQTSNIYDSSALADASKEGTLAVAGESTWDNYRLQVRLRSDDDDAAGIVVRYVDEDNYYRLSVDQQRNYRRLVKKENGVYTTLWEQAGGYTVGEPFTLTLDVAGTRLSGYFGGSRLFSVSDSAHAAGKIGLYSWGNNGLRFEKVEVRQLPLEAWALFHDRFGLGDISAWTVVDEGTTSAPSNWAVIDGELRQTSNIHSLPVDPSQIEKQGTHIVAGDPAWDDGALTVNLRAVDNDAIGVLFRYADTNNYYRFSMDNERSYRRLVKNVGGTFTVLWEDDQAYALDRTYRVEIVMKGSVLRGYLDGVPLFAVEDGDLAVGQIGLYCWANEDARFSGVGFYPVNLVSDNWLLEDSFDTEVPGRWQFVDEGDQEAPSLWSFSGGELRQTANIWGGSLDGSVADKPGTHALAGSAEWSDYRVSVQWISDDNDAIGLMFRYQDEDNYYRFSMDRDRSYRRLIKKVAGAVTILWQDSEQYVQGRPYLTTIDCIGSQLTVYLDGVELVSVEDQDLAMGKIGLYCWGNAGARFLEVHLEEFAWRTYYVFQEEERLPAGSRLRVYAGNLLDAPPEEPNTDNRFVASLEESGQARFPAAGVDLRLVDSNNQAGHTRRFLPETLYTEVGSVRVLRKSDGTGLFLLIPDGTGSLISEAQNRLRLTYRRDNTAVDPNSLVYREAGISDDEQVFLDIPWGTVNK